MTETKRIAILTGGGDVPGLNAVIKSVVYRATEVGYTTLGIRRGWEGLTHLRPGKEPDPDYLRFRFETQYGDTGRPDPHDLVTYLEWCRETPE